MWCDNSTFQTLPSDFAPGLSQGNKAKSPNEAALIKKHKTDGPQFIMSRILHAAS